MNTKNYSILQNVSAILLFGFAGVSSALASADVTVIGTPLVSADPYFAGAPLQVTYTMKNIGDATAAASSTKVQIFTPLGTQYTTMNYPVAALAAGAQRTETHTITVDDKAWSGTWEARVRLDTNFEIDEPQPASNNVATPVPFELIATKPDLKFEDEISPGPCPASNAYGGKVELAFFIHNDSSAPAPSSRTRVQIYDRMHSPVVQDEVVTPAIPAHGKVPFVYSYQLPATGTPGSWSVFVVLNDFTDFSETGAFNNNGEEISFQVAAAGTSVAPCTIAPALINPRLEGANMVFDIFGNAGTTVNLSTSTDLVNWTPLAAPVLGNGVNKYSVARNGSKRYYRAK